MRLATARIDGATRAVRVEGEQAVVLPWADIGALLDSGADWRERAQREAGEAVDLAGLELRQPVLRPEKIFCAGLNYGKHVQETGRKVAEHPTIFAKFWRSLIGPYDPIVLPGNSDRVDWEAELVAVIGTSVRHADEETALAAVAGFTIANDVSMRDWQVKSSEMLAGKAFEAATPVGPFVVTGDEIGDGQDLLLQGFVGDEEVQSSSTGDVVFSTGQLIAYISQFITLVPGDLVLTGTPSGIGAVRKPPRFLQPGEELRTRIEGIGELRNPVLAPAEAPVPA